MAPRSKPCSTIRRTWRCATSRCRAWTGWNAARLREQSDLPVIFLTSKDDEADEALGLAMGADDYIAKPFSQRLLLARIRAILRRGRAPRRTRPQRRAAPDIIRRGRLAMDPARHLVTWATSWSRSPSPNSSSWRHWPCAPA
jgi:DNA-binding response OmpR family regulator